MSLDKCLFRLQSSPDLGIICKALRCSLLQRTSADAETGQMRGGIAALCLPAQLALELAVLQLAAHFRFSMPFLQHRSSQLLEKHRSDK